MPWPDSMYQAPLGSTPACFHSPSSSMCVPDLSPRETKRDCVSAIRLIASTALGMPLIFAGSSSGPMMTKSLYMTRRRFSILPSSTYFRSTDGRVDQGDVGLAARGQRQRLPRADRDRLDGQPRLLLEHGHQHVEEPRVLRARGRRQDHRRGLRLGRRRPCQRAHDNEQQTKQHGLPLSLVASAARANHGCHLSGPDEDHQRPVAHASRGHKDRAAGDWPERARIRGEAHVALTELAAATRPAKPIVYWPPQSAYRLDLAVRRRLPEILHGGLLCGRGSTEEPDAHGNERASAHHASPAMHPSSGRTAARRTGPRRTPG